MYGRPLRAAFFCAALAFHLWRLRCYSRRGGADGLRRGRRQRRGAHPADVHLSRSGGQQAALEFLISKGQAEQEQMREALRLRNVGTLVNQLLLRGFIERTHELARPKVRPKVVPHLRLQVSSGEAARRARTLRAEGSGGAVRRAMVLDALAEGGPLPLAELRAQGLTPTVLRDLQGAGLAVQEDVTVVRDPLAGRGYPGRPGPP